MSSVISTPEAVSPAAASPVARRLWVTWQDPRTRSMHLVGCLTQLPDESWSFWYVQHAWKVPGFNPFAHFPNLRRDYRAAEVFPMFANRVMSPHRPDYGDFLTALDLSYDATPFDILARSSGDRATDSIRVYPEPSTDPSTGRTSCLFLAHGVRHIDGAPERIGRLRKGDPLGLRPEPDNPSDPRALLLDARQGEPVGYVPALLLDYVHTVRDFQGADVVVRRVNPAPAPPTLMLLCEVTGLWPPGPPPFTGPDYEPIPTR